MERIYNGIGILKGEDAMSSVIKSFSVCDKNGEQGDMFYIQHGTSNFTIIDCCLNDDTQNNIVDEIIEKANGKNIIRIISTHPDEDHICGLEYLDEKIRIVNFYCVKNCATKKDESESFKHYCKLRDNPQKAYYVYKDCKRKWMNEWNPNDPNDSGCSGINFLWPITSNSYYQDALQKATDGTAFNNLSPIFTYKLNGGVKVMWMGDMEHDFLDKVKDDILWQDVDILFAPHHGRESGKIPPDVLKKINPQIIVIGEAPSQHLNYYSGYNTITQNSAKDITFRCETGIVHVYVSSSTYSVDYLKKKEDKIFSNEYYIGSFDTREQ